MLLKTILLRLFVLFPLACRITARSRASDGDPQWSYDNIESWGLDSPMCDGFRQSPIHLISGNSAYKPIAPLVFENYDVPLRGPLKLVNNGHTINMDIPPTRNGRRAMISGGKLPGRFEAIGVHFHWGAPNDKGSEHMIDNQRYDVEMHIVHRNVLYESVDEAGQYADGLAVLAIMFNMVDNPDRYYPGLNKIFNRLPQLTEYESTSKIKGQLTVGQLIGDVNTKNFFTYKGSLTTPPCSEAVTWQVFPDPLPIASSQIFKFFEINDANDDLLLSNYRTLQNIEGRKVIYRAKPANKFSFLGPFKIFNFLNNNQNSL